MFHIEVLHRPSLSELQSLLTTQDRLWIINNFVKIVYHSRFVVDTTDLCNCHIYYDRGIIHCWHWESNMPMYYNAYEKKLNKSIGYYLGSYPVEEFLFPLAEGVH